MSQPVPPQTVLLPLKRQVHTMEGRRPEELEPAAVRAEVWKKIKSRIVKHNSESQFSESTTLYILPSNDIYPNQVSSKFSNIFCSFLLHFILLS